MRATFSVSMLAIALSVPVVAQAVTSESDPKRTLPGSNAAETWRAKRGQAGHWVLAIPLDQARSRTAK